MTNDDALADAMVAMPLHEFGRPAGGVDDVKVPLKFVSLTETVCAAPGPVAVNDTEETVRITGPGVGPVFGVGVGVGDGVGTPINGTDVP